MAHKFDVNNKQRLDNPRRREMLPIDKMLNTIGLKFGEKVADIGCGIGYFSLPIAGAIGSEGTVFALDVEAEMIEDLDKKIKENNIDNIQTVITEEYNLQLDDAAVSYAFICTVLHEIEDRIKFMNETKRILNLGGKVTIVEWIKKESEWGPPINHRIAGDEVMQELTDCGFKDISYKEINELFYVVTGDLLYK